MVFAIVLAGIIPSLVMIVGFFHVKKFVNSIIEAKQAEFEAEISRIFHQWVDPAPGNKPSQLAEILSVAGGIVGAAAAENIMKTLQGEQGHVSKVANNLISELQPQQTGLLGLLAGGKKGKGAGVAKLAELLAPMLLNKTGDNGNGSVAPDNGRRNTNG